MFSFNKSYIVGLDVGQQTVKAVVLSRQGKCLRRDGVHLLNCRAEGLVDPEEVRAQLVHWLGERGLSKHDVVSALPQYVTTTQVTDFPPGAGTTLGNMVAYETQQLAGLSEESFVHDFCPLEAGYGRENPVLIGICRSSVANEMSEQLLTSGVRLSDLGIPGVALASAYFDLHPEAAEQEDPQLLLDIGTESSILVVIARRQIVFMGSLLFGSHRYTQALARHLRCSEEEADRAKCQAHLNSADTESPIFRVTRQLENELRTALEQWRSQERTELAGKMFGRICVSGGGALLSGLADHLGRTYGCEGKVIGYSVGKETTEDPRYLIAYGLALQGAGTTDLALSMAPPSVSWLASRRRGFTSLAAAVAVLFISAGLSFVWFNHHLTAKRESLERQRTELSACQSLIPQLEDVMTETAHREKMLIPLVARANRAHRFLSTIEVLSQARDANDWFIYLADRNSYLGVRERKDNGSGAPASLPIASAPLPSFGGDLGVAALPSEFINRRNPQDVALLDSMIVAGYTPWHSSQLYKQIREIQQKLNASGLFKDVDVPPETERKAGEAIFNKWVELFRDRDDVRFKSFILKLPFATHDILPVEKPKEKKIG